MAVIHNTTLTPSKLEMLASWLPGRTWYQGGSAVPRLAKAGGFRIDDPDGEVGIELMVVTDSSGDDQVAYLVPFGYRGAPLAGADDALIGTGEHGVLGTRWIYDGTRDPVVVSQMFALLAGQAQAQAQNISDTVDPSVTRSVTGNTGTLPVEVTGVTDDARSTDITVRPAGSQPVLIRVNRVLQQNAPGIVSGTLGHVTAEWAGPGISQPRGRFLVLRVP